MKIWKNITLIFVGAAAVAIQTLGFVNNQWNVANDLWFESHQLDSESLVVGRLAKSRQDGILSAGGLTGQANYQDIDNVYLHQYLIYLENLPVEKFSVYSSQVGFQAMVFSFLDQLTDFTNYENLVFFKILTSTLTAIGVTAIIFWIYSQFGSLAAVAVFVSALASQWLVVFGRNLWWEIWAFYLPMLVGLWILRREERHGGYSGGQATGLLFVAIFIKCLFNGYEYITTALIMMMTPWVYYAIRDRWSLRKTARRFTQIGIGGVSGVFASMVILMFQIAAVRGTLSAGVQHIIISFGKRAHGNPDNHAEVYRAALEANVWTVVNQYLKDAWCNPENIMGDYAWLLPRFILRISYEHVILLFLIFTGIGVAMYLFKTAAAKKHQNKLWALIGMTWFSLLAPLSWFVIFKGHSFIHTHMNAITWHMPFMFLGFALVGYVATLSIQILKVKISDRYKV